MTTTYSVHWRPGKGAAVAGLLEVAADAIVFTPADGGVAAEVPLADVPAVHRNASVVELERRTGAPIWIDSITAGVLGECLEAAVELAEVLRALREEHDRIDAEVGELRTVIDALPRLTDRREREVGLLATDLMRRIVHHAHVEEQELYPAVEQMLGCRPLVEAMLFDHRAIEGEARDLVRIDPGDRARLACVFHRLDALLTTHVAKEEAIVFPLLESR
jgi:hemerythrin-like domain-containing protein